MKLWVASHKHVNMNFVDLLFMMNNTFYDHYLKLHLSQILFLEIHNSTERTQCCVLHFK